MLIEWHVVDGKAEFFTVHKHCCDKWNDNFEYYVNFQPDGLILEVPNYVEFGLLDPQGHETDIPIVRWAKLGKMEYCPFCGERINMYKTVVN